MSKAMRRVLGEVLLASGACLAVPVVPAVANGHEAIKLRVPVQLKKMLPKAENVIVRCALGGQSVFSEPRRIVNGEFDQVIELVFTAKAGEPFIGVKDYHCHLHINHSASWFARGHVFATRPQQPGMSRRAEAAWRYLC